jgi:hypothetical protein
VQNRVADARARAETARDAEQEDDEDADENSSDDFDSDGGADQESNLDKAVKIGGTMGGPWGFIFKKIIYPFLKTITGMH